MGWCPREGQLHAATLSQLTEAAIQSPLPGKKPLSPSLEAEVLAPAVPWWFLPWPQPWALCP